MQPEKLAAAVDENTIGVAAVLGTTYTGAFEDVATLDKLLGETLCMALTEFRDAVVHAHPWRVLYERRGHAHCRRPAVWHASPLARRLCVLQTLRDVLICGLQEGVNGRISLAQVRLTRRTGGTWASTWTLQAAALWRPSCTQTWSGTSACPTCCPSMLPATSAHLAA
jgi:hypothetical protein